MRMLRIAAAASLLLPLAAQAANPVTCAKIDRAQVVKLFDTWNATAMKGTPAQLAALYTDDAVLLPAVSNKPRYTKAQRIEFFSKFDQKRAVGHVDEHRVQLGCNAAIDSGVYTLTLAQGGHVKARYTLVYVYDGKRWLIANHHSSAMPSVHEPD
jgi:uncharacterized protein (TIGR02246 family)